MFKDVKGFSLVELAIGLMVVGLLLVPFVQYLTVERKRLETEETQTKYYQSIARAIGQFYLENEAYPCPAPLGRPITEAAAGLGACADIDALADDTCDFSAGAGYCKVVGTSPSPILIGAVPFENLRIPSTDALDAWDNKYFYAVTRDLTSLGPGFDPEGGAITVNSWDECAQDGSGTCTGGAAFEATSDAHLIVFSLGKNSGGAFNLNGIRTGTCPMTVRGENCDFDDVFDDATDDDFLVFVDSAPVGIWTVSSTDPDVIYNTNPGSIGVGTNRPNSDLDDPALPSPYDVKLDVEGDIRANEVNADELCDLDGNCFMPDILTSRRPDNNRGYLNCWNNPISGIQDGVSQCATEGYAPVPGQACPDGQVVTGFDASGNIICTGI